MQPALRLSRASRDIQGRITLAGSKSISNRILIIRALCQESFPIELLANAKDTVTLEQLLSSTSEVRDAGAAGTTFRFLTAYLSTQPGTQILTGSERMKQRPIGVLVEALRQLGAKIDYLEQDGYPPLRIGESPNFGAAGELTIPAGTSSQYITALLLLAPSLSRGLRLTLSGNIVSRPYIEMTLNLMAYFGVQHTWEGEVIRVAPQTYQARPVRVEADWSAASYYYSMAALSNTCALQLDGLFPESVQGDAVIQYFYTAFGVQTSFNETGLLLQKKEGASPAPLFEYDFLHCPDVAQTVAVTCAGLGIQGLYTGLETLRIKETDRIVALQQELAKVQCFLSALPARFSPKSGKAYFMQEGRANWSTPPRFATYEDHRMAMAFAPLALHQPIVIEEPEVVEKSYPDFWEDLKTLGFSIQEEAAQ